MTEGSGGIGRRMAKGAAWMVAVRLIDRSIGLVSTVILARLLVPADFGVVALAVSVIAVLEIWAEFGFDLALIRDQKAERRHYDTAWTLMVLRGLIVAAAISASAGQMALFFDEPRIESVLYALALMSLIEGCQSIRVVDFRKNLEMHREFRFLMTARVVQFIATIVFAYLWRDFWALVVGILANRGTRLVLSYWMAPYLPRLTLSAFSELFGFSKWVVVNSLLNFVTTRLDTFVIGRISGVSSLGIYSMAYEISNLATTELVWPISRALFPGFSRIADHPEELARTYNLSLSVIVLAALPVTAGIALTADYFVPIVLGNKWLAAIPIMQVLALYGGLRVIIANTGSLYLAVNKPFLISIMAAANLAILAPAMVWLIQLYGPIGAAWAVVAGSLPMIVLMFVFNQIHVGIRFSETLLFLVRPLCACALMIAGLLALRDLLPPSSEFFENLWRLLVLVAVGAALYVAAIAVTWRLMRHQLGAEPIVWALVRDRVRAVRLRRTP